MKTSICATTLTVPLKSIHSNIWIMAREFKSNCQISC